MVGLSATAFAECCQMDDEQENEYESTCCVITCPDCDQPSCECTCYDCEDDDYESELA